MKEKTEVIEARPVNEVVQSNVSTADTMIKMAIEQNADVDKLEKLIGLKERWEATEAKKAYVAAMTKFRAECPAIQKTRQAHNSKYAGLAEAIGTIRAVMEGCGLSHSWTTNQVGGEVCVTCVVTHLSGHSEQTMLVASPDTSGSKNSIQAIGSTVTYLQRYTLFSILGIASTDQDDDGESAEGMALDEVIALMKGAKNLAELDARAKHASQLTGEDKAKARDIYKQRKEELGGNK